MTDQTTGTFDGVPVMQLPGIPSGALHLVFVETHTMTQMKTVWDKPPKLHALVDYLRFMTGRVYMPICFQMHQCESEEEAILEYCKVFSCPRNMLRDE